MTTPTSTRMWRRSAGSSISCCARCRPPGASSSTATMRSLRPPWQSGCWTPRETFSLSRARCRVECRRSRPDSAWRRVHGAAAAPSRGAGGVAAARGAQRHERAGGHRRGRITRASRPRAPHEALSEFRGVKRRMEIRGVVGGVTVYDDFAHHPTAIETTLKGLRAAPAGCADHRGRRTALQYDEARRASRTVGAGARPSPIAPGS